MRGRDDNLHSMRLLALLLLFSSAACTAGPPPPEITQPEIQGRLVVDTRAPAEFARAHAPGAINLQLGWDQLEDRVRAYVPDTATSIALRATDEAEARSALAILADLGYEDVVWISYSASNATIELPSATLETSTAASLKKQLASANPPIVIDVRSRSEYERGTIESALLFEQDEAPTLIADLDKQAHYAIICEGGYRSSQLASLMRRRGFEHVVNVIDGMAGWRSLSD